MPLMTVHSLYLRWPFHYRLCYVWMSIDFTCSTASFLTLASMALDRYWALTGIPVFLKFLFGLNLIALIFLAPYFHLRNRSYSSVLIFIISSWAIPFAIWPGSIFISHHYSTIDPSCVHPAHSVIIVGLCTFFYYIPLLFMLVCYSRIIVNIKNIEVLIKDTCDPMHSNVSSNNSKSSAVVQALRFDDSARKDKTSSATTTSTTPLSSIRFRCYKYFQRNRAVKSMKTESLSHNKNLRMMHEVTKPRSSSNEYRQHINSKRRSNTVVQDATPKFINTEMGSPPSSSAIHHRLCRPPTTTTTTTFKGQKRSLNDTDEDKRLQKNSIASQDDEQQRLVRACIKTYRLSLPAIRYESCCYYQHSAPAHTIMTKATIEDQHRTIVNNHQYDNSRQNSVATERSPSQSPSSAERNESGSLKGVHTSRHDSSLDITMDEDNRHVNHRNQPLASSKPRSSSRYSQHAVAQFMHERRKACLRRNQKASRMLGILLAVFLICWLPFTIFYPTSIFYPKKFSSGLESITFWFGYANSLLNPFLYVYSSRNFRQAIIETLCCHVRLRARQRLRYQWSIRAGQN
ncbi:unnamed protein product [Rotaria socialis]|uniref:G-protein coupled receptors family 1 profile domain-containing protein n=1 Tax=Rotaria socialis TaxID=392032 RepID=A0A817SWE5_9BILA|nr:unnamed protein product [Rotaria socialis]